MDSEEMQRAFDTRRPTPPDTIEEFLLDRYEDTKQNLLFLRNNRVLNRDNYMQLAIANESMREIIEWHKNWPILLQKPVEFDPSFSAELSLEGQVAYRARQQIEWVTQEEYKNRFGAEPPTAPLLLKLVKAYSSHPDFKEEWDG